MCAAIVAHPAGASSRPVNHFERGSTVAAMAEGGRLASEGGEIALWPGLVTQRRRAMRAVLDRRLWLGPLIVWLLFPIATWALRHWTGAPPGSRTGHWSTDAALGWASTAAVWLTVYFLGRLFGLRGALGDVVIVMLWAALPALLAALASDAIGVAVYGPGWWTSLVSLAHPAALLAMGPVAIALEALDLAASALALALMLVGLSEVHRVGVGRIVLTIALPLFVLGVAAAVGATLLMVSRTA